MNLNFNRNKNVDRALKLASSNASDLKSHVIDSPIIAVYPVSVDHNRRSDDTFDDAMGIGEVSPSQCSASSKFQMSEYSYDKRLEYWKNVLKEREKISSKIRKKTKKCQTDILYNRLVTVDERDKFTVKRVLDYAQRLNPTTLSVRQPLILKGKCDTELQETLPKAEKHKTAQIEITGVPKVIQKELIGKATRECSTKRYGWLNSKILINRLEEKRDDIKRVLEHYPDTENLQVVGAGLFNTKIYRHNSNIQFVSCNDICEISADTLSHVSVVKSNLIKYACKVNDQEFSIKNYRSYQSFDTLTKFSCLPFETEVKKILTIENIGRKPLRFKWKHNNACFAKNFRLLKYSGNEFVFDKKPFCLCSGEVRKIFVKFQPRRFSIVKSRWILKVKPSFFKRKTDGIVMNLRGACTDPTEYEKIQKKSDTKMMKKLITSLGTLAVDVSQSEITCPYQRSLNEIELFEQLNSGFKCERYNDLELLKELYNRAKKSRDKMWDLQVSTLKSAILGVPQGENRALLFNEFCGIINSMKGTSEDLEAKILNSAERHRNSFVYVRGIISTAIDEWVDLASILEETFYQTTLHVTNEEQILRNEENKDLNKENRSSHTSPQEASKRHQYEKRVRALKSYRDVLYLRTYILICDFVENIANVIESTL